MSSSFRMVLLRIWTLKQKPFTDQHCNHSAPWQVQVVPLTVTGGEAHVLTCVIVFKTFLTSSVLWKAPFRESHLSLNPTSCSCRQKSVWSPQESKGSLHTDRPSSGWAEMGCDSMSSSSRVTHPLAHRPILSNTEGNVVQSQSMEPHIGKMRWE